MPEPMIVVFSVVVYIVIALLFLLQSAHPESRIPLLNNELRYTGKIGMLKSAFWPITMSLQFTGLLGLAVLLIFERFTPVEKVRKPLEKILENL